MTDAEVFEVVKRALQKHIPSGGEAIMDSSLCASGGKSLLAAQLSADIGQQLGVSISPADIVKAQTGRDIAALASKLASK